MKILKFAELDSTSDEARRRYAELSDWTVITAERQSRGRGQGDHTWFTSDSKNLIFSIILKFSEGRFSSDAMRTLMDTISEGVCDYLRGRGVEPAIKFPNDILVRGIKICGILIETFLTGKNITGAIVGIGFDLNETDFPQELRPTAVSLKELTGGEYDRDIELETLLGHIRSRLEAI